jgi:hypothetical protein
MPTDVRYPPAGAPRAKLAGKTRIAVAIILLAFAVAHLIGASLLQRRSHERADGRFELAEGRD